MSMPNPESNNAPYIVSADAGGLLKRWGAENGFAMPSDAYFNDLAVDLRDELGRATDLDVEVVQQDELRNGMLHLMSGNELPAISLDRAYLTDNEVDGYIDMTRAVDANFNDLGIRPRPGSAPLAQQLNALRTSSESPIVLVDDVIFSGEGAVDISKSLAEVNRPVKLIIAGIAIAEGIERLNEAGIEVACVREYEDVADEVCERDFLAAVPMSGRTVLGENGDHWSAPYFEPFGNAEKWASIPGETAPAFSRFCLSQSVELWSEIEKTSGRKVPVTAVPRKLKMTNGEESITIALRRHLTDGAE